MTAEMKLTLKDAKLALKVSKRSLTRASGDFHNACKELDKNKDAVSTKKVRLAAALLESLETVNAKVLQNTRFVKVYRSQKLCRNNQSHKRCGNASGISLPTKVLRMQAD